MIAKAHWTVVVRTRTAAYVGGRRWRRTYRFPSRAAARRFVAALRAGNRALEAGTPKRVWRRR